jgi:alpha-mannosidase
MENQGLPLGLASLWAGAGAKYSWRGICGCASRLSPANWGLRDHEIYWYSGHDDQRVLLKWHSLHSGALPKGGVKHPNQLSGGYAEAFDPVVAINFLSSDADFLSRYRSPGSTEPYRVRSAFGFGWDALNRKTGQPYTTNPEAYPQAEHFHIVAEKHSTPERQVIVSNQEDFFRDFEASYGKQLPAQSVTYGNEWDLYSASMPETSAKVKRAVEKLRAAEALAAFVSLKDAGFLERRTAARNRAFTALGLIGNTIGPRTDQWCLALLVLPGRTTCPRHYGVRKRSMTMPCKRSEPLFQSPAHGRASWFSTPGLESHRRG